MRYLLAVTLVLQFSGVSAAWPKACAMAPTGAEHACCVSQRSGSAMHVSGSCGCQLTPVPAFPSDSAVSTAPESAADHGSPVAAARVALAPELPFASGNQEHAPPGPGRDSLLSRLSASGFRC